MKKKTKFIYNGILLSIVGLMMRGTQLAFGAYLARVVGADGVGLNTLIMTVYSFALTLASSGISLTVTRHVASMLGEGRADAVGGVLRGAFAYAAIFGGGAGLLLALLSGTLGRGVIGDPSAVPALQILSLSLLPAALSAVIAGYFVAVRRITLNAATQVAGQVLRILLTVILLSGAYESAVVMLALGFTVSELVALFIALPAFAIERRGHAARGRNLSAVAKMALPLAVSAQLRALLLTLEHNLIPKCLEKHGESRSDALASYGYLHGMALPLILYPMTPLSSFSGLLVPEFAEAQGAGRVDKMSSIAARALNLTLSYGIAVSVLTLLFARELGVVVYDSLEAGKYIAILAPVLPIMYLDHVADAALKGIGEHIYSMWVNIADAVLSILLVLFLIPQMGIYGYAVVIIVMEGFNFVLSVARLKKRIRFRINPFRSVLLPLFCAVSSAALSHVAFSGLMGEGSALALVLKLVFAVCAYLAAYSLVDLFLSIPIKRKRVGSL